MGGPFPHEHPPKEQDTGVNPLARDDLEGIADALQGALKERTSPRLFAPLAEARRLAGDVREAIRVALEGTRHFRDHVGIRVALARALADAGRAEEAREAYQEVAARDPANAEARAFLAGARWPPGDRESEGEKPQAHEPGERRQMGSLWEELEHLADLFATPSPSDSTEIESDSIATLTLAEIYARQGLMDKAAEVCEAILQKDPQDQDARSKLEEYRRRAASVG